MREPEDPVLQGVMIIPIRKQTLIKIGSFLVFIMEEPTPSPRGVMAVSAPSWKKAYQ